MLGCQDWPVLVWYVFIYVDMQEAEKEPISSAHEGHQAQNPPCQILAGAHLHFKLLLNICHHSVHGPITEEKGGSC